jgi:predicted transport protein
MIDNLPEKTGRSLEQWFELIQASKLEKHGDILKLLKGEHGLTHGFANTITLLYRQQAEGGPPEGDDLIASQYQGKEDLKAIYETLVQAVNQFGSDVELAPKKAYVSLRRAKQFGIIQPSTKTRIDLGLNLKGVTPSGALIEGDRWSGMCSHRIEIHGPADVTPEVIDWLKKAYERAG